MIIKWYCNEEEWKKLCDWVYKNSGVNIEEKNKVILRSFFIVKKDCLFWKEK
jgi:hypothetical protein